MALGFQTLQTSQILSSEILIADFPSLEHPLPKEACTITAPRLSLIFIGIYSSASVLLLFTSLCISFLSRELNLILHHFNHVLENNVHYLDCLSWRDPQPYESYCSPSLSLQSGCRTDGDKLVMGWKRTTKRPWTHLHTELHLSLAHSFNFHSLYRFVSF